MATASEKAELSRLANASAPVVHVVEVPRLSDSIAEYLPRAASALREWDEKVEVWRKSISFAGGASRIVQVASAAPPVTTQPVIEAVLAMHDLLSTIHQDTLPAAVVSGDLIFGNATPKWARFAHSGEPGMVLVTDSATSISWSTVSLANSTTGTLPRNRGGTGNTAFTDYTLIVAGAPFSGVLSSLPAGVGTSGQVLTSNGAGTWPVWQDGTTTAAHNLLSATHSDVVANAASRGALIYGNATLEWDRMLIGAPNRLLRCDGTDITWAQVALALDVSGVLLVANGGTGASNFTPGSVIFMGASVLSQDNANFFWDDAQNFLGLGTAAPAVTLDVGGGFATRAASPAAIDGNTNINDYPIGPGTFFRLDTTVQTRNLFGITGGVNGKHLILVNISTHNIVLANQSTFPGPANRMITGTGFPLTLAPDERIDLIYDAVASRWRCGPKVYSAGSPLPITSGGTGAATASAAFNALSPLTVRGDLLTMDATNDVRLGIGAANSYLSSNGVDPAWAVIDGSQVAFVPGDLTDWNAGTDPGNVDDALDQLADNLSPLLPPSAPALDDIDFDSANGPSGRNTWNAANPITNYANAPADSVINPGDALDATMTAGANAHGVYDFDTIASVVGTLNEDVTAHTFAYPADSFSPGGSDGGATNRIELYVNNALVHSTNLLTLASGNSLNGNGSGFTNLSAATSVLFSDGSPFASRKYRTGGWTVVKADMLRGWNTLKVKHVTAAGTLTSDVQEFLLDDDNTATTFTAESISAYAGAGSKVLSGVTYHTSASATYNVTINNAYRNTYRDGNAITYQVTNLGAVSAEALGASSGNEALSVTKNKAVSASGTWLLNAALTAFTSLDRTVQSDLQSAGATLAGVLIDFTGNGSADSGTNCEPLNDELYRVRSNVSLTSTAYASGGGGSGSPAVWDSAQNVISGSAGHTTGLLLSGGQIQYPTQGANGGNFGGVTNGPGGNPNYSGATGNRVYLRYFYFATSTQNFAFVLGKASATTFNSVATGASGQGITVEMLAPNTTQNGSATVEWKDALVAYTDDNGIGCQSSSGGLGAGSTSATLNLTLGTRSTATSGKVVLLRITAASAWTGNINNVSVT